MPADSGTFGSLTVIVWLVDFQGGKGDFGFLLGEASETVSEDVLDTAKL